MDRVSVVDGQPSTFVSLLGFAALVYYTLIWYIGLTGLSQSRKLYGRPSSSSSSRSRSKAKRQFGALPLRHPGGIEPPRSPPPPPTISSIGERDTAATPGGQDSVQGGVSILRPLAGLDHNLASNLASAFEQRYPKHLFEIILSVHNADDQALRVAQTVCARYADVQSTIIVGDESCGVNPKICNLVRPYARAKFDIVWVLDAQVHVSPYALARAVEALQSPPRTPCPTWLHRRPHGADEAGNARVGLAHHIPLGVTPHSTSFGSHVEATFLSTNHAKMYLAINAFSIESCVMGKSNLYRKSDIACIPDSFFNVSAQGTRGEQGEVGSTAFQQPATTTDGDARMSGSAGTGSDGGMVSKGAARPLARFGIYLAEDNMLGTALWKPPMNLAHKVIAKDIARTSVGEVKSIGDYWHRRVRWIRVRRHMVPSATYVEPFTESIVCGAIATWAFVTCWLRWLGIVEQDLEYEGSGHFARVALGCAFFLLHMTLWHIVDFTVLDNVQNAGQDEVTAQTMTTSPLIDFNDQQKVWYFRLAWLCREVLALPIWFVALCDNKVIWRGRPFRILSDARAAHLSPRSADNAASRRSQNGWLAAWTPSWFLSSSKAARSRAGYEGLATSEAA